MESNTMEELEHLGLKFRKEVIQHLLATVGDIKFPLEQFLSDVTAKSKTKELAYNLFRSAVVYISKHTELGEKEDTILRDLILKLHKEWIESKDTIASENGDVNHEPVNSRPATDSDNGDVNYKTVNSPLTTVIETSERDHTTRSITPNGFVRETQEPTLPTSEDVHRGPEQDHTTRSITPNGFVRETQEPILPTSEDVHLGHSQKCDKQHESIDLKSHYPMGHQIMSRNGWDARTGLSVDGHGIRRPINIRDQRRDASIGLGYQTEAKNNPYYTPTAAWKSFAADPVTGDKIAKELLAAKYDNLNAAPEAITNTSQASVLHGADMKNSIQKENTPVKPLKHDPVPSYAGKIAQSNKNSVLQKNIALADDLPHHPRQIHAGKIEKPVTGFGSTSRPPKFKTNVPNHSDARRDAAKTADAQQNEASNSWVSKSEAIANEAYQLANTVEDKSTVPRNGVWEDGALVEKASQPTHIMADGTIAPRGWVWKNGVLVKDPSRPAHTMNRPTTIPRGWVWKNGGLAPDLRRGGHLT